MEKSKRSLSRTDLFSLSIEKLQSHLFKGVLSVCAASFVLMFLIREVHADQVSQWEWKGIDRIVAIGDVHGSYDKFVTLLKGTKLVDENLSWTGGAAHLVMVGELWTGARMIEESLNWSCACKTRRAQQEDRSMPF